MRAFNLYPCLLGLTKHRRMWEKSYLSRVFVLGLF